MDQLSEVPSNASPAGSINARGLTKWLGDGYVEVEDLLIDREDLSIY